MRGRRAGPAAAAPPAGSDNSEHTPCYWFQGNCTVRCRNPIQASGSAPMSGRSACRRSSLLCCSGEVTFLATSLFHSRLNSSAMSSLRRSRARAFQSARVFLWARALALSSRSPQLRACSLSCLHRQLGSLQNYKIFVEISSLSPSTVLLVVVKRAPAITLASYYFEGYLI